MSGNPKIFSREYYQRLYEVEERHWWSIGMRDIAARMMDPYLAGQEKPLRILDAGCGTGLTISWLERYADPEGIVGIDLAWFALEFCKSRKLLRIAQASITQLPFADNAFDLVACVDVIQHLPLDGAEAAALTEMRRVLRPGGLMYIRTNAKHCIGEAAGHHGDEHYHRYTREELERTVGAAGFTIERVTHTNLLLSLVAEMKKLMKPSRGHHSGDKGLAIQVPKSGALNEILLRIMKAEAAYLASPSRRLSFGHSLICLARKPIR